MGKKVNPIIFRIGVNRKWPSSWYGGKDYAEKLHQDIQIRNVINNNIKNASISSIGIERAANKLKVTIVSSRPGMIISKKGEGIAKIKKLLGNSIKADIVINIIEEKKPEVNASLVAENIAVQLEKRVSFRKAAKRAIQAAMRMGAKGIKVSISGRLGGAEIARTEWYKEGRVPLHTLRALIDYDLKEADTTFGVLGVKVWIYKGESVSYMETN